MEVNEGKKVIPGDKIGVIEEFEGKGDVIINHGVIRSTKVGELSYDMKKRVALVKGIEIKSPIPKEGDIVIGVVEAAQSNFITIRVNSINNKRVYSNFTSVIFLPSSPIKTKLPCKIGDVVKAKVKCVKNGAIFLSLAEPDLGVIKTSCSLCGGEVVRVKTNIVKCVSCGYEDYRKLSTSFR